MLEGISRHREASWPWWLSQHPNSLPSYFSYPWWPGKGNEEGHQELMAVGRLEGSRRQSVPAMPQPFFG